MVPYFFRTVTRTFNIVSIFSVKYSLTQSLDRLTGDGSLRPPRLARICDPPCASLSPLCSWKYWFTLIVSKAWFENLYTDISKLDWYRKHESDFWFLGLYLSKAVCAVSNVRTQLPWDISLSYFIKFLTANMLCLYNTCWFLAGYHYTIIQCEFRNQRTSP